MVRATRRTRFVRGSCEHFGVRVALLTADLGFSSTASR